jgi:nucleoside-diphosphate-sugar epimerase
MNINRKIISDDLNFIYNSNIEWNKFYNKTILISGASGFLPAYLVETLMHINLVNKDANIKIIGLVRNISKAKERFMQYENSEKLEFLVQDVCEKITINYKIDFIIHAASQASPKYYGKDPVGTINANLIGTTNLLELARRNNVEKFLFFSSSEVYGQLNEEDIPTMEDKFGSIDPCNVRSCYSEGKRAGETICISWKQQYNIPVVIVRPFHTYGPGMDLNDGRVYADFIKNIVNNENIEMKSDGSAIRAFCYISDATIAFFKVLLNGEIGVAYNIGNDKNTCSILQLAESLVSLFPKKNLNVIMNQKPNVNYIPSLVNKNIPNINKIRNLKWEPIINIKEGFTKTIKYYDYE